MTFFIFDHTCLFCSETTVVWLSVDIPNAQPPGHYEGELIITATRADAE